MCVCVCFLYVCLSVFVCMLVCVLVCVLVCLCVSRIIRVMCVLSVLVIVSRCSHNSGGDSNGYSIAQYI